jgi:hypothetical protein
MRAVQHTARLSEREAQSRSWAAPLPDLTVLPRVGEGPRTRMEWETRDTMNNRLWADTVVTGAKTVTAGMLAAHPTAGAEPWMPSAARQDRRPYGESAVAAATAPVGGGGAGPGAGGFWPMTPVGGAGGVGFTHWAGVQERPAAPPRQAWLAGVDAEGVNAARELRHAVKEDLAGREEDSSGRMAERMFQNQWMTRTDQQRVVVSQLEAAEALRPGSDDFRVSYRR